ncbi:MAG: tetratricopeptide repeat protein [Fimbriimonas sp.]
MARPNSSERLRAAIDAFDRGDIREARSSIEAVLKADNGNADAFSLQGVILARAGEREAATEAFRKALMLAPTDPKSAYNLAAHIYAMGNLRMARDIVVESLKDDPIFAPSRALLDRIDANESGEVQFFLPQLKSAETEAIEAAEPHVLPFMRGMERSWATIGWIFVGVDLLAAIGVLIYRPFVIVEVARGENKSPMSFKTDPGSVATIFLLVVSAVFSIVWMLIDVIDKKMRIVWLVPVVSCCTCGMHGLPHALYMLMRRT